MLNRRKILLSVIVVTIGSLAIHSMRSSQASIPEHDLKPVSVAVVTRENLSSFINMSAEFRPFQEADLHAKVSGYLKGISVDIGDQVKAGQVIATLDIQEFKDDLNRTTAAYRDAKLDYDRVSVVIKKRPGLLAQEEVDKAQAEYEMAKANMERAQTFLDYATITVPFDGVVTKRYVDPGALIQASVSSSTQTLPIVHIAQNNKLRLDFPVPESVVSQIKVGTPVDITVKDTGQIIKSSVTRLAGKIDSNTRTMETEIDVDNPDLRITPGMYAAVKINIEQKTSALSLPVQAVLLGEKPNVWRVNEKNEIEERPVRLGLQTADKLEILDGIGEGDRVIFGSRGALSTGMKVEAKPIGAL